MDPLNAMTIMLTGKNLIGKKAKRLGLLDMVTQERHFAAAVRAAADGKLRKSDAKGLKGKMMNLAPARKILASQMEKQTARMAQKQHYPAPYSLIDIWREHGDDATRMLSSSLIRTTSCGPSSTRKAKAPTPLPSRFWLNSTSCSMKQGPSTPGHWLSALPKSQALSPVLKFPNLST